MIQAPILHMLQVLVHVGHTRLCFIVVLGASQQAFSVFAFRHLEPLRHTNVQVAVKPAVLLN